MQLWRCLSRFLHCIGASVARAEAERFDALRCLGQRHRITAYGFVIGISITERLDIIVTKKKKTINCALTN